MSQGIGKRREKRIAAMFPIRLWGMDACGRPFIEASTTINISRSGVLLRGIPAKLAVGDIVGLTYSEKKYKFRIIWTGGAGTSEAANVGLQSLDSGEWVWDLNLPSDDVDIYSRPPEHEHRLVARVKCFLSVEVCWESGAQRVLAFIRDLSLGGCYVTMASPLRLETRVSIGLWLDDQTKIWADGIVISSHPGAGMGIKFLGRNCQNLEAIERYLEHLSLAETQPSVRLWFPSSHSLKQRD